MLTQSPHRLGANAGRNSVNGFCIAAATILRWRRGGGGRCKKRVGRRQRGEEGWREQQDEAEEGWHLLKVNKYRQKIIRSTNKDEPE